MAFYVISDWSIRCKVRYTAVTFSFSGISSGLDIDMSLRVISDTGIATSNLLTILQAFPRFSDQRGVAGMKKGNPTSPVFAQLRFELLSRRCGRSHPIDIVKVVYTGHDSKYLGN